MTVKNGFIKKMLGWDYSDYNHGKSGTSAKRSRTKGQKIIREKLKKDTQERMELNE